MNINIGKKLMVDLIDNLLALINENDWYKDNFIESPVSIQPLHLTIFGMKEGDKEMADFFEYVSIVNGVISYDIESEVPRFPPLITIHSETYEEVKMRLSELSS